MAESSGADSHPAPAPLPYEPLYPSLSLDRPSSSSATDFEDFVEAAARPLPSDAAAAADLRQRVAQRVAQDAVAYFGLAAYGEQLGSVLESLVQRTDPGALDSVLRSYAGPPGEAGEAGGPAAAAEPLKELFQQTALRFGREQVIQLLGSLSRSVQNPTVTHVVKVADTFAAEEFTVDDMPLLRQIVQLCPMVGPQRIPTAAELQNVSALLMPKVTHFVSQTAAGRQLMVDSVQAFALTPLAGFISALLSAASGALHHASSALASVSSSAAAVSAAAHAAAVPLPGTDGPANPAAPAPEVSTAPTPEVLPAAAPEAPPAATAAPLPGRSGVKPPPSPTQVAPI
eukprot:EG_transcript_13335